MIGDNAYNTDLYKRTDCKRPQPQEDYCTPVYNQWCKGILDTDEHQKPAANLNLGTGETQSDAKPSQF
jgi:hypothetical protein